MKVIDLIDMIWRDEEELPKEILITNVMYTLNEDYKKNNINFVYEDEYGSYWLDNVQLSDEIEIAEEDKEIAKIDFRTLNTQKEKNRVMKDTINQLIDEINELKKGK